MNDKQQLEAICEQLAAMGERMGLQVQPMCMAKRIEELEAQVRVMAGLLREAAQIVPAIGVAIDDLPVVDAFLDRIEAALAGNLPAQATPEGWQLVPVNPTPEMIEAVDGYEVGSWDCNVPIDSDKTVDIYQDMLAAAPKPEAK